MEYKAVGRGSLKLKGGPFTKDGGVKKKKKQTNPPASTTDKRTDARETDEATSKIDTTDTRTPAQRKFDEIRELREEKEVRKRAGLSHRERIEAMNTHLARLSEHNDMPKIGPG